MDSSRFDALTRRLSSRRTAVTGVLGGVAAALLGLSGAEEAGAHNPIPACRKIADPVRRRKCLRRARRHNRQRHFCKPQPVTVTCANRCGRFQNNCRRPVNCPCAALKLCLANKSCSRFCHPTTLPCPAGCFCGLGTTEDPTVLHCLPPDLTCSQIPQVCTSTAQCPPGQLCVPNVCGSSGRCHPVCPV